MSYVRRRYRIRGLVQGVGFRPACAQIAEEFGSNGWVDIPVSIPGDVNGDGYVSSVDVTALYNYLLNGDDSELVNGDQDGDGIITSVDITIVYNILLGN